MLSCSEGENEVWYYSSRVQLEEILQSLDRTIWEGDLVRCIEDYKEEFLRHMQITEELTNEHRGNRKSQIEVEDGSI